MDTKNKLVSYCLFTYNQEKYIKDAVLGALNQSYSPLEIIISDDCSTDSTIAIVNEIIEKYQGSHRIVVNVNDENMGLGGHVSKVCYSIAKGDYIITSAGDDISKENHVDMAVMYMEKYTDITMIDFNAELIDGDGEQLKNYFLDFEVKKYSIENYLSLQTILRFAPGRIIRKSLLTSFEPINKDCPTEDSVLELRSLLLSGYLRINIPLVYYRQHNNNLSSPKNLSSLSNAKIIEQYKRDIKHFYSAGRINNNQKAILFNRVNLEFKLREAYYISERTSLKLLLRAFRIRALKFEYKLLTTFVRYE